MGGEEVEVPFYVGGEVVELGAGLPECWVNSEAEVGDRERRTTSKRCWASVMLMTIRTGVCRRLMPDDGG